MPAKKAAGEAAASPKNVKAEKPVEAAKKAPAAVQKDVPARAGGKPAAQGAAAAQGNARPISTDPAEAKIQIKMNEIEAKIAKYRGDLDKLKQDMDDEKVTREKYFAEQKQLRSQFGVQRNSSKGVNDERKVFIEQIQELRRVTKLKRDDAKKIKERLPHPPGDESPAGQEAYGKKIEDEIKTLEKGLASNAYPLAQEKKKVEEISLLQKAKKIYKEYLSVMEKINQDSIKIKELEAKLDETKDSNEKSRGEADKIKASLDALEDKIQKSKEKGDALWAQRGPISDNISKLRDDFSAEKKKLDDLRQKKWEDTKVQRDKERAEAAAKREANNKKWEENKAKRTQEEDAKTPYEDEIYLSEQLINYLNSLLPKKTVAATTTTAAVPETSDDNKSTILKKDDDEGDFVGKKKVKKQKAVKVTQDLKHNVEVFLQFETVSLIPPAKLSDVEASIAELQNKKEHYQKLSATSIKEKAEKRAAEAAAEAAKKAEAAAATPTTESKPETPAATTPAEPVATSNE